jgi:hypothetical protein
MSLCEIARRQIMMAQPVVGLAGFGKQPDRQGKMPAYPVACQNK